MPTRKSGSGTRNSDLRVGGVCFFVLAVYVACESASDLLSGQQPEHSIPGIALACGSLIVMPLLARAKRRWAIHCRVQLCMLMLNRLISVSTYRSFCWRVYF